MDFASFATEGRELRCSSLPYFLQCPSRILLEHMLMPPRDSGEAADTGTAVHVACAAWHSGKGKEGALQEMRDRFPEYEKADLDKATRLVDPYTRDPRNYPEAVIAQEVEVLFSIPAHPLDPTGKDIALLGHYDQLRNDYSLWDIKTGEPSGWSMLHTYAPQLAAYVVALEMHDHRVKVGGIIRPKGYTKRVLKGQEPVIPEASPDGIFFYSTLTIEDCETILHSVRLKVAMMRRGYAMFEPGEHCNFCHMGGLSNCLPEGRRHGLVVL